MNNRLKQIIFDKLYNDLKHLEIIPYQNSFWFIDREEKFWYLEYKTSGALLWRWQFFSNFFELFSMERDDFEPIISEWVEQVLNCKVEESGTLLGLSATTVEQVLNCKVEKSICFHHYRMSLVGWVLNCKVDASKIRFSVANKGVEEVLKCKVEASLNKIGNRNFAVEEVLNHKNN